jgi:predicted small integral membrane protein
MLLRVAKIALVASVALWGFIGAFHNLIGWGETLGAVAATTSMATFDGGAASWQATANPIVIWAGALFTLLSKLAAGGFCALGALRMWRTRKDAAAAFAGARQAALAGCAIAVIMLFGGFIVVAEGWFELWRSAAMRAEVLDAAFRYGGMIALIGLLVATGDE